MSEVLLVISNLPDEVQAQQLADRLIESRLAACVNRLAPCVSTYYWDGKLNHDSEVPLLIKTTREAYPALEALIRQHHPYELPEIIAISPDVGLPAYLAWVAQQVSVSKE